MTRPSRSRAIARRLAWIPPVTIMTVVAYPRSDRWWLLGALWIGILVERLYLWGHE